MKRIVWTHEEKTAIYKEMVVLLTEEELMHVRDLLSRAQLVLPVERRRDVSYNMVFNYKSLAAKAQAAAAIRRAKQVKEELTAPPAPPPAELTTAELVDTLLNRLAGLVVDEMLRRTTPSFQLQYPRSKVSEPAADVAVSEVAPVKKTGILVIGLNGQQMNIIKTRFPNKDVMFVSAEDAKSYAPIRRDYTILMTKFISHAVQNRYRQAQNLQYCNGGVSELTTMITRIR